MTKYKKNAGYINIISEIPAENIKLQDHNNLNELR
jgi:hypothetical protein